MDWLEDGRPQTKLEGFFRHMVKQKLKVQLTLLLAKQDNVAR
jgi:predicted component of type VI protein secretion system